MAQNRRSEIPRGSFRVPEAENTKKFTKTVKNAGLRTNLLPKGFANLNGRCERVIETIKLECLGKFIVFGKRYLDHLVTEFVDYYNTARSSIVRGHLPPVHYEGPDDVPTLSPSMRLR